MTNLDEMIYRIAYRMALADGEFSQNESTILAVLRASLGISPDAAAPLEAEAGRIDETALYRLFPDAASRHRLFETACLLVLADGRADVAEWRQAVELARALYLDRPAVEAALGAARARLHDLARTHDLGPEIRANLARTRAP